MKNKSIFWRCIVTIVVLGAWTSLLFPWTDKDFRTTFEEKVKITNKVLDRRVEAKERKKIVEKYQQAYLEKNPWLKDKSSEAISQWAQRKFDNEKGTEIEAAVADRMKDMSAADKAEARAAIKKQMMDQFTKLMDRAAELKAANKEAVAATETDPSLPKVATKSLETIILDLIQGDSGEEGFDEFIPLGDFVSMVSKSSPSPADVVYYIRNSTRSRIKLGLDLKGGTEFIIAFDDSDVKAFNDRNSGSNYTAEQCRDQVINILRERVDPHGVTEVEIRPNTSTSISVRTPITDASEINRIERLLRQRGNLKFHIVHSDNAGLIQRGTKSVPGYKRVSRKMEDDRIPKVWITETPAKVDGSNVEDSYPMQNEFGHWLISMRFDAGGGKDMGIFTNDNLKKPMAIVLDDVVYSIATIQSAIHSSGQITGNFSQQEAQELATVLKSGSLPVNTRIDSKMTTNPTLGKQFVKNGLLACGIGMGLVVLFMLGYYRVAGVIAIVALTGNILLIVGSLPLMHAALTLPGIAGIVLTIGMAVDANVLIFERIREELIKGKTIATAVKNGYARAFTTILDANLTTLFTAFFLYKFGSGTIKGFAVTLTLGILASMFTALFVTRWIFDFLVEKEWLTPGKIHSRISAKHTEKNMFPDFQFLSLRKVTTMVSIVLVVGSIAIFSGRKGGLSTDFRGGTQLLMGYVNKVTQSDVIEFVKTQGYTSPRVTYKESMAGAQSMIEIVLEPQELVFTASTKDVKAFKVPDVMDALTKAGAVNPIVKSNLEDSTISVQVSGKSTSDPLTLKALFDAIVADKKLESAGFANFAVTKDGTLTNFNELQGLLNGKFPEAEFSKPKIKNVGSLISGQFAKSAILSMVFALIVIILYISFRFEFGYGIGAVAALVHDVVICTGIYLAWGGGTHQISLTVIAALLTIIGYSLNDTIVVFDRVRENVDFYGKKKKFLEIVNMSLNQTLSRTLITSATTFLVVATLYAFGGGAIDDFALVMMAGIVIGTYSSIFIATPVMVIMHQKLADRETSTTEKSRKDKGSKKRAEAKA